MKTPCAHCARPVLTVIRVPSGDLICERCLDDMNLLPCHWCQDISYTGAMWYYSGLAYDRYENTGWFQLHGALCHDCLHTVSDGLQELRRLGKTLAASEEADIIDIENYMRINLVVFRTMRDSHDRIWKYVAPAWEPILFQDKLDTEKANAARLT